MSWKKIVREMKLGDRAEAAIGRIPQVKRLPCYDESGNLKPLSGCGRRKRLLNGEFKEKDGA